MEETSVIYMWGRHFVVIMKNWNNLFKTISRLILYNCNKKNSESIAAAEKKKN